ncbi:MAG: hypothetical protein KBG92_07315 [Spirochaetes bacterium]|nr:hypothetical protein [Spirochaetota bacterium]
MTQSRRIYPLKQRPTPSLLPEWLSTLHNNDGNASFSSLMEAISRSFMTTL